MNRIPICWTLRNKQVCFVHLGKFGDIIIMLPAFKAVADEMGRPPIVMVSNIYHSVFEGVSYVKPWIVNHHWWGGIGEARRLAESQGFQPIVVKWWDEPGAKPPPIREGEKTVRVKFRGEEREVAASEWDSYQSSQWRYAGFTVQQMMDWPLIFDRRNPDREAMLRKRLFKTDKPKLLVSLSMDGTSPFWNRVPVTKLINQHFAHCEIVEIWKIKAFRIFDLLGLYDHAAGMITSDTATLHLAPASRIPYMAFVNDGGGGSVPRGNCVASIRYHDVQNYSLIASGFNCLKESIK